MSSEIIGWNSITTTLKQRFFDPRKENTYGNSVTWVSERREGPRIGASRGLIAFQTYKLGSLHFTDLHKPWVSVPTVIPLPSLGFGLWYQTINSVVSFSCGDPVKGDDQFYAAATFKDLELSVCKPFETEWTHIESSLLPAYKLMYSKRDKAFYFTSLKGLYLGVLDPTKHEIKCHHLRLRNMPDDGNDCKLTKHLVESPSGELFFIMWFSEMPIDKLDYLTRLERFMVFREDEKSKDFCYTENIGDLCIFLGNEENRSEDFCVSASMYKGLLPNSIYYVGGLGGGVGSYNLAKNSVSQLAVPYPYLCPGSYWISPC